MAGIMCAMVGSGISVNISPGDQSASGSTATHVFSAQTVTVTGGTPSSYTWSFNGQTGGIWSIAAGQSTATAAAQVGSVGSGASAIANFNCAVVVNGNTYNVFANLDYDRF